MQFELKWTPESSANYDKLKSEAGNSGEAPKGSKKKKSSRQAGTFKQVCKVLRYLARDPKHPSLQTHKYDTIPHPTNPNESVFEAYAQNDTPGAYRIFWCYGPKRGEITLIAITPHP